MQLDKSVVDGVHVLTPKKDLMGGPETRDLEEAIEAVESESPRVVVDLGRISFINSTGLGSLIAAHLRCQKRNGWLRIARPSRRIKNVFLITRLSFELNTFDSVEDALRGGPADGPQSSESLDPMGGKS